MKIKDLQVLTPQGMSGELRRLSQFEFDYKTDDPTCAVSLALPLEKLGHRSNVLPPVFSMSLPEGYLLNKIHERLAKFEKVDDMRLLHITGQQTIGRLEFVSPNEAVSPLKANVGLKQLLRDNASQELFEHLVETYLHTGISGAQPKVMIPDADHPMVDRATMLHSNLIVKTGGVEFEHLSLNEFICMDAARRAGINVPNFWLSDDNQLFIMERFDLRDGAKLGFEDMTVILDQAREQTGNYKYRHSYETLTKAIKLFCGPNAVSSAQAFYEYLVLSVAVRNGDAHLKNFGLLYEHPHSSAPPPKLAPLYDVVTTAAYDETNQRTGIMHTDRSMALKLNKRFNYPTREELIAFGKEHCYVTKPEQVIERISEGMIGSLYDHQHRVPETFFKRMQQEWEAGIGSIGPAVVHVSTQTPPSNDPDLDDGNTPSP
jgi:serine/threonine-protein kinase HipA